MKDKLCFVTSNKGKVREAQMILGIPIEIVSLEIDEVQHLDLSYVVEKKAEAAYKKIGKPLFVDDVGVYVEAWNGFPGPFIKYILQAGGNKLLTRMLENERNRKVLVKSAIAFHDGKKIHTFIGEVKGQFIGEARGGGGWGFDPVFIPDHSKLTWGEMGEEEKNHLSHRQKALHKLAAFLKGS